MLIVGACCTCSLFAVVVRCWSRTWLSCVVCMCCLLSALSLVVGRCCALLIVVVRQDLLLYVVVKCGCLLIVCCVLCVVAVGWSSRFDVCGWSLCCCLLFLCCVLFVVAAFRGVLFVLLLFEVYCVVCCALLLVVCRWCVLWLVVRCGIVVG